VLYFYAGSGCPNHGLPGNNLPLLLTVPGGRMRTRFPSFVGPLIPGCVSIGRFFLAVLVVPVFLTAGCAGLPAAKQSAKKHVTPAAKLEAAMLAKGVDLLQTTSDPRDVTDFFTIDDEQVVLWVKLGALAGVHHLRWEWYAPSGELYVSSGDFTVNSDGKSRPFSTAWHKIAIKGEKAATLPGQWQVRLFLDGDPAGTSTFYLRTGSGS
jgi:hypothetical protein